MLTEQFLNLSCVMLLNKSFATYDIHQDIKEILEFYGKSEDVPLIVKNKFDVVQLICKLRCQGSDVDTILDSIISTSKYVEMESFIKASESRVIIQTELDSMYKQIKTRKKLLNMLSDYPSLTEFVDCFENNMFDDMGTAVTRFEEIICRFHSKLNAISREESTNEISDLNLLYDDYTPVIDQIKMNYSGANSVPTHYQSLDKYIKNGFQPKRLYIFGGASGDGKSTLLMNILSNQLLTRNVDDDYIDVYLYVTMENLVDESLLRLYACMNRLEEAKIMDNWDTVQYSMMQYFKNLQIKNGKMIHMSYFPPSKCTIEDILSKVDDINSLPLYNGKKIRLKEIMVDYLDLMKSGTSYDLYRLELGQITIELKFLSVITKLPIITLTQLNREGYDKQKKKSLVMIGESIKKVENADLVAMLTYISEKNSIQDNTGKTPRDGYGHLNIDILKNRCGAKDVTVKLNVAFPKYYIWDANIRPGQLSFNMKQSTIPKGII